MSEDPLQWLDIEHHNLTAAVVQTCGAGLYEAEDRIGQAHVRFSQGVVLLDQGDVGQAKARLLDAHRVLSAAGDARTEGQILRELAQLYRSTDRLHDAAQVLERLALERRLDDQLGQALTVQALGEVRRRQGRAGEARALLAAALESFRVTGYEYGEALALRSLGNLHLAENHPRLAVGALSRSLAI